jgi:hypothetical protein
MKKSKVQTSEKYGSASTPIRGFDKLKALP